MHRTSGASIFAVSTPHHAPRCSPPASLAGSSYGTARLASPNNGRLKRCRWAGTFDELFALREPFANVSLYRAQPGLWVMQP